MLKQGAAKHKTQNQVQIFCMINALKIGSKMIHSPRAYLYFSTDLILFRQTYLENVSRTLKLPICQRISIFNSKKSKDPYEK